MGKKNKNKKKITGAEKTQAKTEKKLSSKIKKELQAVGEEDIQKILNDIEQEENKRLQIVEAKVNPPSRRLNFTFVAHPEKDQLILYGGEFFNGQKTFVYNDLYFYNIPNNTWTVIKAPNSPPPRCGHQMVATASNKGQLWVFGGEFASPTQSQFYHYRDFWVYQLSVKKWEKITAPNSPTARSGHRMVYVKKHIFVFGGFYDNLREYKYFNDIYHFNIETYKWLKLTPGGNPPGPRSACCMIPLADSKILIYGGYRKDRTKKNEDKGHVYSDAFLLIPEKNDDTFTKFRWVQTKLGGIQFSPRCSMPIILAPNQLSAYCYGGVFDVEDDEENISGIFFDDMFQLDLTKMCWRMITLVGKKENDAKRGKKVIDGDYDKNDDSEVNQINQKVESTTISDDGVFKVTFGQNPIVDNTKKNTCNKIDKIIKPSPRINCGLAIKQSILYLYGGMYEDGDKQITFNDFYSLDIKKIDEWKAIVTDETFAMEWLGSDSEEGEESSEADESEDKSDDSTMETD